jgi:hypothetical protein
MFCTWLSTHDRFAYEMTLSSLRKE